MGIIFCGILFVFQTKEAVMQYSANVQLKNGIDCCIQHCKVEDAQAILALFTGACGQSDFMNFYPDEVKLTLTQEQTFIEQKKANNREVLLCAKIDADIVAMASITAVGNNDKLRHRAEFGITVLQEFWAQGIGNALMQALIEVSKNAGYAQLECSVVAENTRAIALYQKYGFQKIGCNPKGFRLRDGNYKALLSMALQLE